MIRRYDAAGGAMIDNFAILFSTLMVMYIVWRAAKLDRVRPWFETRSLYDKAQPREAAAREAAKRKAAGNGKPRVPVELLTNGSATRR
ncbi:MAG: hypothetical protein ACHQIO_15825 [Nevskiales bacterium]